MQGTPVSERAVPVAIFETDAGIFFCLNLDKFLCFSHTEKVSCI